MVWQQVMRPWGSVRLLQLCHITRMLVLALALACQVSAGAIAQPSAPGDAALSALAAASVLCQSGHGAGKGAPAPVHHHLTEPAIAGTAHLFAATLGAAGPALPGPSVLRLWRGAPGAARAPPRHFAATPYPTGPPSLI
jgi:hypothetical protein